MGNQLMANICTSASFQRRGQISTSDKCSSNIPVVGTSVYIEYTPKNLAGQDPTALTNTCQPDTQRQPHFSRHLEGNSPVYIYQINRTVATLLTAWQNAPSTAYQQHKEILLAGQSQRCLFNIAVYENFRVLLLTASLGGLTSDAHKLCCGHPWHIHAFIDKHPPINNAGIHSTDRSCS